MTHPQVAVDPLGFGDGQEGVFVSGCKPEEEQHEGLQALASQQD